MMLDTEQSEVFAVMLTDNRRTLFLRSFHCSLFSLNQLISNFR
jgi:hypothetical protein